MVLDDCQFLVYAIIRSSGLTVSAIFIYICSITDIEHSLFINIVNYIINSIYIYIYIYTYVYICVCVCCVCVGVCVSKVTLKND